MTNKQNEIHTRKDRVLGVTVEEYIRTVVPVSSSYIAEHHFYDLSSATIRNILAELEEDGFLTHPHTSAGRVPTQKGYR
ncbi:MAG: HrcA family transcriptional regulator, partial [Candidatus Omnitrophica bacterium]|nr:HrcA family transcriptional regulator [Candidatus Omnitrophota bacterium]